MQARILGNFRAKAFTLYELLSFTAKLFLFAFAFLPQATNLFGSYTTSKVILFLFVFLPQIPLDVFLCSSVFVCFLFL